MDHPAQPTEPTRPKLNLPPSEPAAEEPTPLGFKVIAGLAIAYVILRIIQMVGWSIDWLRGLG